MYRQYWWPTTNPNTVTIIDPPVDDPKARITNNYDERITNDGDLRETNT